MAQQFMGGGVAFDEGQGVREAGNSFAQMGNTFANIAQQLTAQKNMALIAAEQARKDFFDTATQLGIPPQAYASTDAGKAQYQTMLDYQNKALNAGKLLDGFGKPKGYQDSAQAANQFADFNSLTPQALGYMSIADQTRQNAMQAGETAPTSAQAQPQVATPNAYNEQWAEQAGKPREVPQASIIPNAQAPQTQTPQVVPVQTTQATQAKPAQKPLQKIDPASALVHPIFTGEQGITREVIKPITGKSQYFKDDVGASKAVEQIMSSNQFKNMPESVKQDMLARYQAASQQVSEVPGVTHRWTYTVNGKQQVADTKAKAVQALANNPQFQPQTQSVDNAPQTAQTAPKTPVAQVGGQISDPQVDSQFREAFNAYAQTDPTLKRVSQQYKGGMTSTEIWNHSPEQFKTQWLSKNGTLPPGVTLGNSPRADAQITYSFNQAEATAQVAVAKGEPIKVAFDNGTTPTPQEALTFKNALAQSGNNYAKALQAIPESTRKAVTSSVVNQIMSMDSTKAELAGMHEIASRKEKQVDQGIDMDRNNIQRELLGFQKEELQARLAMAQLEAMSKLSTSKFDNFKTMLTLVSDLDKSFTDKAKTYITQYKGNTKKMYAENPDLLDERNMITAFKKTAFESAGFDSSQMDFEKLVYNPGGWFGFGNKLETVPFAQIQENATLAQARQANAKEETTTSSSSSNYAKVLSQIK